MNIVLCLNTEGPTSHLNYIKCPTFEAADIAELVTVRDMFRGQCCRLLDTCSSTWTWVPNWNLLSASVTPCLLSGSKPHYFGVSFSTLPGDLSRLVSIAISLLAHPSPIPVFLPLLYLSRFKLRDLYKLRKYSILELHPQLSFVTLNNLVAMNSQIQKIHNFIFLQLTVAFILNSFCAYRQVRMDSQRSFPT